MFKKFMEICTTLFKGKAAVAEAVPKAGEAVTQVAEKAAPVAEKAASVVKPITYAAKKDAEITEIASAIKQDGNLIFKSEKTGKSVYKKGNEVAIFDDATGQVVNLNQFSSTAPYKTEATFYKFMSDPYGASRYPVETTRTVNLSNGRRVSSRSKLYTEDSRSDMSCVERINQNVEGWHASFLPKVNGLKYNDCTPGAYGIGHQHYNIGNISRASVQF